MNENLTFSEHEIIVAIADRFVLMFKNPEEREGILRDIIHVHSTVSLNLVSLLSSKENEFSEDMAGIYNNWNHETAQMRNGFLPIHSTGTKQIENIGA